MSEDEQNRGSGVSIDDPYRLAPSHPTLGVASQKLLISRIYGEQNKDWFDGGRTYHADKICEQKVRLPSGQVRSVFFDERALDYSLLIPEHLRGAFERAAANVPVPDTQLISRFPLIEVKAGTAADAAKIIITHLQKAEEQGWVQGIGRLFVDGWRNEYDLTRGDEKTVMSFDMRPALLADSRQNLMLFSALGSFEKVDKVVARMEMMKRSPNVAEVDLRRLVFFGSVGAIIGALIGLFVYQSILGTITMGVVGLFVTLAVCWKLLQDEAAARGLQLRIRREK